MMELNQKNKKNIFLQKRNGLNIFVMIEEIKMDHILQSRGKKNRKIHVTIYHSQTVPQVKRPLVWQIFWPTRQGETKKV